MPSVKDLKLLIDNIKVKNPSKFDQLVKKSGKTYSKFLKPDLEALLIDLEKGSPARSKTPSPRRKRKNSSPKAKVFSKCADDFISGKYCEEDKPNCNIKTGNCTKVLPKTDHKQIRAGHVAYSTDEDLFKKFENYTSLITKRHSESPKNNIALARAFVDVKETHLKGCYAPDADDCPAGKPICSASGNCIKTKPAGGSFIQMSGKKIYGKNEALETLMKNTGVTRSIRKDGVKAASPKKASPPKNAPRKKSRSRSKSRPKEKKPSPVKLPPIMKK
jgi:hypothetical protein